MNYSENVKTKSLGLAIVLTLLFGPLGLFYASISGGLIMTLTPFVLVIFLLLGVVSESVGLLASSAILLVVFGISYWIICVIWAATSVSNYNNKAIYDARESEFLRKIDENRFSDVQKFSPKEIAITKDKSNLDNTTPTFKEWQKENLHCSINDYYRIYGVPNSVTSRPNEYLEDSPINEEKSYIYLVYITVILFLLIVLGVLSFDKKNKSFNLSNLTNSIGLSSDKKDIELQIENVYFGLINGAYTSQSLSGTTPENLPFYNSNLTTLFVMGFAPLTMLSGNFSLEPKNIEIHKIYENNADVSYDLFINNENGESILPINMTLKKIGGKWKLDAQKFLPFNEEQKTKKKKKHKN